MRTFGYHYSKEPSRCSPQSCDQLPCCREHFLSVILVSGPRPTTTASKCGSLIRWWRLSCLTNQHTRIMTLRDKTEENHGKTSTGPPGPHPRYHTCHIPSVHLEASDFTSLVSFPHMYNVIMTGFIWLLWELTKKTWVKYSPLWLNHAKQSNLLYLLIYFMCWASGYRLRTKEWLNIVPILLRLGVQWDT